MSEIQGAWPGGPRRRKDISDDEAPAHIETMEERARRKGEHETVRSFRRRRRRVVVGFLVAVTVAGGVGFAVGVLSHQSTEDLTRARLEQMRGSGLESTLRRESDRVIQQMWLTELEDTRRSEGGPF